MLTFIAPEALFALLLLPLLAWGLRRRHPHEWAAGWLNARVPLARLTLVLLIILSLAQPVYGTLAPTPLLIVVADQSASLGPAGQAELRARAAALLARTTHARLVVYGGQPAVADGDDVPAPNTVNPAASDPAAALDLAGRLQDAYNLASATDGGRVVLLSDGQSTQGDALAAAARLHAQGVTLDVWPYLPPVVPDAALLALDLPSALRVGEPIALGVQIYATEALSATLTVWEDRQPVGHEVLALTPGINRFTLDRTASAEGPRQYEAQIVAAGDAVPENDALSTAAWIYPAPHVLIVAPRADGGPVADALGASGVLTSVIAPARLPTHYGALSAYDGIVLRNVPASALALDQMLAVEQFARVLGRGVVVLGGRQSFTLGGYAETPLAAALPLSMEPPEHPERPPIALLLIVDHSASMGTDQPGSKLTLAKQAALLSTNILRPDDYLGVLAFDDFHVWSVPFQLVGEGTSLISIQDRIAAIPTGGSTKLYSALQVGLPELLAQPTQTRHVVVITDGLTADGDATTFEQLASSAREQGATISTIAVGIDANAELTAQIAEWGGGRYHFTADPADLPRLALQETRVTQSEPVAAGTFAPQGTVPHPLMRGYAPADLPSLTGYIALTARPAAEVVLEAGPGDPLLAVWQYGLGRVLTWSADDGTEWASAWRAWPRAPAFWNQLVRYTLAEAELADTLAVRGVSTPDGVLRITVNATDPNGRPLDLADASATVRLGDGRTWPVPLTQSAPGVYGQSVALPGQGAYFIEATVQRDGYLATGRTIAVSAYPDEYRPDDAGPTRLAQLAALGGGTLVSTADEVALPADAPQSAPVPLWPWTLAAVAVLFPVYIALRREARAEARVL